MACVKISHDRINDFVYNNEPKKRYKESANESHIHAPDYLMENEAESHRLEVKTRPEAVRKQSLWCGLKPGMRVLDAGCGPGKVTSILYECIQPDGSILGVDYSDKRIRHANEHYRDKPGIDFKLHDLRDPLEGLGEFDIIWVRFVLEYNLLESPEIVIAYQTL